MGGREMKQYKTCNGCKALSAGGRIAECCTLGFGTKPGKELMGYVVESLPTEPCPKPKSIKQYVFDYRNNNNYKTHESER